MKRNRQKRIFALAAAFMLLLGNLLPVGLAFANAQGDEYIDYDYEGILTYRKYGILTRDTATGKVNVFAAGDMQQYLSRKAGLKYIADDDDGDLEGKWRMVYCLKQELPTPHGDVTWNPSKSVSKEVIYCMTYGVQYWGKQAYWKGYRIGDWKKEYYATQMAIHVLQGEFTADSLGNADPAVRQLVDKMIADAKNSANYSKFDGLKYTDISYKVEPQHQKDWVAYTYKGTAGYATKVSYKQIIKDSDFEGNRSEWLKGVKATLEGAPAGVQIVWNDSKNDASFYIFATPDAYNSMKATGANMTIKLTGQKAAYLSGWYYDPGGHYQPVSFQEPSWSAVQELGQVTAEVIKDKEPDPDPDPDPDPEPEPEGAVTIIKVDAESQGKITGAEFTLYEWSNAANAWNSKGLVPYDGGSQHYKQTGLKKTDDNGGKFKVVETKPADGYIHNDPRWEQEFTVSEGNTDFSYTATNGKAKGKIQIQKKNANPGMGDYSLAGAVFEIRDKTTNELVDTVTTDASGFAESKELDSSKTYIIKETAAPPNMVVNSETWEVQFNSGGAAIQYEKVEVPEKPQFGRITVHKKDSETGDTPQGDATLFGAEFQIHRDGQLVETLKCPDDSNSVTSGDLPLGTYTVKESWPSTGYQHNTKEYTVNLAAGGQNVEVTLVDQDVPNDVIKGYIALTKFVDDKDALADPDHKVPLKGVSFEIKLASSGKVYDTVTTDEFGFAKSKLLPYGKYIVTEMDSEANEGYKMVKPFSVEVYGPHEHVFYYILKNDTISQHLKVVKRDIDSGEIVALEGATFKILDPAGNVVKQKINYPEPTVLEEFLTGANGYFMLPDALPYGKGYKLVELQAPYGYLLNDKEITFDVTDKTGVDIVIDFSDKVVKGKINIEKKGEVLVGVDTEDTEFGELKKPMYDIKGIPNTEFDIIAKYDIETADGIKHHSAGDVVATLKTDEDGKAESDELYLGTYLVVEKSVPAPLILNDINEYEVTLEYEDQLTPIVHEALEVNNDRQKVKLEMQKSAEHFDPATIEYSMQHAEGYIFGLFADADILDYKGDVAINKGDLVALMTTDELGKAEIADDSIPHAEYYVMELKVPEGIRISDKHYPVDARYAGEDVKVIEIALNDGKTIENYLLKKQVRVIKRDSRDEERGLAGAIFQIVHEDGYVLCTMETNDEGIATSLELPYMDKLKLVEVKPPVGFMRHKEPIEFDINDESENIIVFEVENEPTKVIIEKTDIIDEEPVPGAEITIEKDDGTEYGKWITPEDGKIIIEEIPPGMYVYYETMTVPGYSFNTEKYSFEVMEDGSIKGDCKIKNKPTEVRLEKVDKLSGLPMIAEFRLLDKDGKVIKLKRIELPEKDEKPVDEEKPEATPTPTTTPEPTPSIQPTETPIATQSPQPTATSEPAATATPTDTGSEPVETEFVLGITGRTGQVDDSKPSPKPSEKPTTTPGPSEGPEGSPTTEPTASPEPTASVTPEPTEAPNEESPQPTDSQDDDSKENDFLQGLKEIFEDGVYVPAEDGDEVFKTSIMGKASILYLSSGENFTYTIEEVSAVSGYHIVDGKDFMLTSQYDTSNPLNVKFENEPTQLLIEKRDSVTDEPLAVEFRLLDGEGNAVKLNQSEGGFYSPSDDGSETFFTSESGIAEIRYLPVSEKPYQLVEVNARPGYALMEPVEINIPQKPTGEPIKVLVKNEPLAMQLFKIDGNTKNPLKAGFVIEHDGKKLAFSMVEDGVYRYSEDGATDTIETDNDGTLMITHLPAAFENLKLIETVTPEGYSPVELDIVYDGSGTVSKPSEVTVENYPVDKPGPSPTPVTPAVPDNPKLPGKPPTLVQTGVDGFPWWGYLILLGSIISIVVLIRKIKKTK